MASSFLPLQMDARQSSPTPFEWLCYDFYRGTESGAIGPWSNTPPTNRACLATASARLCVIVPASRVGRKASRVTSNALSHGGIKKIRSPTAVKMIGAGDLDF